MKTAKIKKKKMIQTTLTTVAWIALGFGLHMAIMPNYGAMMQPHGDTFVSVQGLDYRDMSNKKKFIASVEAINRVDIVPQISGYLEEVRFSDGAFVNVGDVLFVIEQSKFKANVEVAEADLEKAKSDLTQVSSNYRRQQQLYKEKITPKAEFEIAENKLAQAKASVKQAEANLKLAQINLGYTEIKSPISGYIGKALVSVGNYVSPQVPSLARIVQTDPIRIGFSVSDKERIAFLHDINADKKEVRFDIVYPDGKTEGIEADNIFAGNEINPETATLPVYVDWQNPDNALIPGNYVDILVSKGAAKESLVVPMMALASDVNGTYVLTVTPENKVEQKYITVGRVMGDVQEVLSGLTDTDKVIVQGIQKVQAGMTVKPIEVTK